MRYGLLRPDRSVIEISHENFAALKWSYLRLLQMAHIEEKFDVALENMLELEQEFLAKAAADMMFHLRDTSHDQAKLNRRFVNLLTSCRLYLDHSDRHAYDLFGRELSEAAEVRELRSKLYDSHLGYRVKTVDADAKSMPAFLRSAVEWRFRDIRCALTVVSRTTEGQFQVEFTFPNITEIRRRELEAKNARPPMLSKDYVSSRTNDDPLFAKLPDTSPQPDISWDT